MKFRKPRIGQIITLPWGAKAIIRRIHPAGTLDVEASDGRWYRMTGLPF